MIKRKRPPRTVWRAALLVLTAALALLVWRLAARQNPPVREEPPPVSAVQPEELSKPPEKELPDEVDGLPVGKLVITPARRAYESGEIILRIPKLDLVCPIYNGTDADTLRRGVGLYEYAQLPAEGNCNVSLAGHRNGRVDGQVTDSAPFYYIDTVEKDDCVYLIYQGQVYRYLVESLTVVEEDDWTPICTTGGSCVTITSCHPIGISDHRIVLRAALDEVAPEKKDDAFLTCVKEEPQDENP